MVGALLLLLGALAFVAGQFLWRWHDLSPWSHPPQPVFVDDEIEPCRRRVEPPLFIWGALFVLGCAQVVAGELLREGIVQVILASAEDPLVQGFLVTFIHRAGAVREQLDNKVGKTHPLLPDDPTLALSIVYIQYQKEVRSTKAPLVLRIVVDEHVAARIIVCPVGPVGLQ